MTILLGSDRSDHCRGIKIVDGTAQKHRTDSRRRNSIRVESQRSHVLCRVLWIADSQLSSNEQRASSIDRSMSNVRCPCTSDANGAKNFQLQTKVAHSVAMAMQIKMSFTWKKQRKWIHADCVQRALGALPIWWPPSGGDLLRLDWPSATG